MTIYALVAAVVVTASAGAVLLLLDDSEPGSKVIYYDGDVIIGESAGTDKITLMGFKEGDLDHRTFFGWSENPDNSGDIHDPGYSLAVKGTKKLYAVTVNGTMVDDGKGSIYFDLGYKPVGNIGIDMSFVDLVDVLKISTDTISGLTGSLTLIYPDGVQVIIANKAVSTIRDSVSSESFSLVRTIDKNGGSMKVIGDGSKDLGVSNTSDPSGWIDMKIPRNIFGDDFTYVADRSTGKIVDVQEKDGFVEFSLSGMDYDVLKMYGIKIINVFGETLTETSVDRPEIHTDSESFSRYGLFSKGDVFSLSELPADNAFELKGADYNSDGSYTVNGKSDIIATIVKGKYRVILPEADNPLRYTITADPMTIESGSRCILTYGLKAGFTDEDLVIKVNGVAMEKDSMCRIYVDNVQSNLVVEVSGVYDIRTHKVVIPEGQVGYELTSTESIVHHREAYSISISLLANYETTSDFRVYVNDVPVSDKIGTFAVKNVMADQTITVVGVRLIEYEVSVGTHLKITNGNDLEVTKINYGDIVKISPVDGYTMPDDYDKYIPITAHLLTRNTFSLTGDTVFPGIVKVTPGKNTKADGKENTVFIPATKGISLAAIETYELPSDYSDKVNANGGVTYSDMKYYFAQDVVLPSVYQIKFLGYSSELLKIGYACGGSDVKDVVNVYFTTNPTHKHNSFTFNNWVYSVNSIAGNMEIASNWSPNTYEITFGVNLHIILWNDDSYIVFETSDFPVIKCITADTEIMIKVNKSNFQSIFDVHYYSFSCLIASDKNKERYVPILSGTIPGLSFVYYYVDSKIIHEDVVLIGVSSALYSLSDANVDYWEYDSLRIYDYKMLFDKNCYMIYGKKSNT